MNILSAGFWRYHFAIITPGLWALACIILLSDLAHGASGFGAIAMTLLAFVMLPISLISAKNMIMVMMVNYHKSMLGTKYPQHEQDLPGPPHNTEAEKPY
jgi:hypothetical protein